MTDGMVLPDRSYTLKGSRTGVLLIHGLGGTPLEMKYVAKGLNAAGYTVHCPQLAGHCGTEDDLARSTWQQWMQSVERGLEEICPQCDTLLVGGLSVGCLMAMLIAERHPQDFQGMLLFAPTLRYDGFTIPWYSFLLNLLINTPMGQRYRFYEKHPYGLKDERVRKVVVKAMQSGNSAEGGIEGTPSQSLKQFWQLQKMAYAAMPHLKMPAFVAHARVDDISSLRGNAFVLQSRLGGLVETLVLDDCYHLITLDRQRHILIDRACDFSKWVEAQALKARKLGRLNVDRLAELD